MTSKKSITLELTSNPVILPFEEFDKLLTLTTNKAIEEVRQKQMLQHDLKTMSE